MALFSLTASHHELDLDAIGRLSAGAHLIGPHAVECDVLAGAVVLATCNRLEVYLDVDAPLDSPEGRHAARHVARVVARASGVDVAEAEASLRARAGSEVAQHLFAVASGLDSMVVGEREIAGQVRRALESAHADGLTSATLEQLFQTALRTSKQVGTDTALGGAGRTVVALGLDLAAAGLPPWRQVRTVLIGTGSYARASLAALRTLGCDDVEVYSQSGRAADFATAHGARAVSDLVAALADADLVVSCSGVGGRAPATGDVPEAIEHVLDAASVVRARERAAVATGEEPGARPMVVLDLALHRDVEPHVADVEGVLLYDLATLAAHSPSTGPDIARASEIVGDAGRAFEERLLAQVADAEVVALVRDAERRITAELGDVVARRCAAGDEPTAAELAEHTRRVRRRVRAELHRSIVTVRAQAVETSGAAQRLVGEDVQPLVAPAGAHSGARQGVRSS